ncbi:MAG: TonB-dependent receptor [Acidobacteria bacterium]|nr:TonB-dependent receptor [Acidobacteriota bacterium]
MRPVRPSALVIVTLLFAAAVWAQTATTSVRGTVTDRSGAAVTNATILLSNPERATQRATTTGSTGQYEFLQLPPGTYELVVQAPGFRRYEEKNVQLLVNTPTTANVSLEVGASSETVEVTGEATLVNTTDASLGNAFNERQVKELPLEGRNVPDLLSLQAGVAYTGNRKDVNPDVDTRSGAVNGAHSDQSNVTLDGVDVNDQVNGYAFSSVLPVTLDSVQEFRVTTTNYNADQGRSSGAQVSLVTKSGTNNFHGTFYEYHRNTFTSANDWFVKSAELATAQPNEPLKLIRNIFGASLGGPIRKGRLFFFLNYEGYRQREESSVLRIVPSDTLRDGVIVYQCASGQTCPGGTIMGNTGPHAIPSGFYGLNAAQLKGMDPLKIGPNSIVLGYLNTFPHANDVSAGDGVNYVGYRFRGPVPTDNNWYIARADYTLNASGTHALFWRGALRNDLHSEAPYLPGTAPLHRNLDLSRGYTVGYTATLRPTLLNNFRYGYTRQSIGRFGNNDSEPFIYFRGLNDDSTSNFSSLAITRSRTYQTPVHNLVDDLSWTKGKHTLQFGTNIRFIRNPRSNFINSFPDGVTNASALDTAGLANKSGSPLNPANNGFPIVDSGFNNSYDYPLMTMMGIVTQLDASYNYTKTGAVLPEGAPVRRRWGADEYEFYTQDSFRLKPNLTLTYGLRYSLFSPPWETTGTQVAPTIGLGQWFKQRGANMLQGIGSEADPTVSFNLAGPANGKPGYYSWNTHNFAPRLAFAYSPRPNGGWLKGLFGERDKTVIRGGFGIVYDRIGAGLLNTFDQRGSFGLSTQLSNSTVLSVASAPRLSGLNTVPTTDQSGTVVFPPAAPGGFPYTPPPSGTGLGIYWGLDNSVKTPYTYTLDFSIGRELPKNMNFQISYVGHLAHHLLAQEDLAMPLNLVDPRTGVTYFQAASALAKLYEGPNPPASTAVTPAMVGPTASYWQDVITPLKPGDAYNLSCTAPVGGSLPAQFTTSVLQAVYDNYSCYAANETTALAVLDFYGTDFSGNGGILGQSGTYYPPIGGPNTFFDSQFHSLYAWRSIGNANYNAMQVNLRKRLSQGVQFDFNYTYSKSIDLESDAERVDAWNGLGGNIINSWFPNQLRGVSDFDTTHQLNLNWMAELPFGKGKPIAPAAHGALQALVGGWQLAGVARWTSGFPVSISNGATWPTNWQLGGEAIQVAPVHTGLYEKGGKVNLFADPQGPTGIQAFRHDLPGESGMRNTLRGPGYAGLDAGLAKRWTMPYSESHSIEFRWDVFNVLNLTRFDVQTITSGIDAGPAFGDFSGLLTQPRVMQFALRYEF